MRKDRLAQGIMWRMAAWGFAGGAGAGIIYGVLLFTLVGSDYLVPVACMTGFLVGGLVGGPLGLLNGLVLVVITRVAIRLCLSPVHYQAIACSASGVLTCVGALLGLATVFSAPWDLSDAWWFYIFIPALIAAAVAVIATVKETRWVKGTITFSARVE